MPQPSGQTEEQEGCWQNEDNPQVPQLFAVPIVLPPH
jgi:hypothetical protein